MKFKKFMLILIIALFAILNQSCSTIGSGNSGSGSGSNDNGDSSKIIKGAKLPPTGHVTRKYPKLVNYFHMDYDESNVSNREERLAQWDVLIINDDHIVKKYGLSLTKIRQIHPDIKILIWVPFGQEPLGDLAISTGIPDENNPDNWFAKTINSSYVKPYWGGHMMNPYKKNFAWAKYAAKFIKNNYLNNGMYDGVMFDCLGEYAPNWAASDNPPTFDTDENGVFNETDNELFRQGIMYLIETLRLNCPNAIITGNGGVPWSINCQYFQKANGCLHENALGNEFGSVNGLPNWNNNYVMPYGVWDGYKTSLNSSNYGLTPYYFIISDTRYNRTQDQSLNLKALTEEDKTRIRLGLCASMMMDHGYFGFDRGDCLHGQLWWFDEYDVDMGNPKGEYTFNKYANGSISREFDNGTVIINPTSVPMIIKLTVACKDVSTGAIGTNFIILPNDGRIYYKK